MLGGCKKVVKNLNDTTPPTVVIKVRGVDGQYAPATTALLSTTKGSLDMICINSDPEGVSSIDLTFIKQVDSCTTADGGVFSGYNILGLPPDLHLDVQPDPQGNVPTSIPLLATVKGPLTCNVFGTPPQQGFPIGAKVMATCTGKNWSSNAQKSTAQKVLTITLQ
jgi:hypothetical protein